MVISYPMNSTAFKPGQLSLNTAGQYPQNYFVEDGSILDDFVLDPNAIDSGIEVSPPMTDSRRHSFAVGNSLFSPKFEDWQPAEMQPLPPVNPFTNQSSNNPFVRMNHPQQQRPQQPQHHHHHAILPNLVSLPMTTSMSAASGIAAPITHFDGFSPDFDNSASAFHRNLPTAFAPMPGLFQTVHALPSVSTAVTAAGTTTAMSVPMRLNDSNDSIDTQAALIKSLQSPMMRTHNDLRRGDGIRKKNSRFDIPPDRNLNNIDGLISRSTDEQEIRELKQQKRLLRNRQAALDSRQRKKQHTERLEDEKKHYTNVMSDMEQTINDLRMKVAELQMEKQNLLQYVENLTADKDEILRQHTAESAELRKKISVMSDHIQALEKSTALAPSPLASPKGEVHERVYDSTIGTYSSMGDLGVEAASDPWEDLFHSTPSIEQSQHLERQPQQVAAVKAAPETRTLDTAHTEKPTSQGGLLFMLFLVGAFVMSNRQMPSMPPVSDEIRVASAELLDNVLRDAGMPNSLPSASVLPLSVATSTSVPANSAATSATTWAQPTTVEPSLLGQLSDQLIQTTDEQAKSQVFSLDAVQYSGVVSSQYSPAAQASSTTSGNCRRNLADTLANLRSNNTAEVYTRSLLWDQIPGEIVRSFINMVSAVNTTIFNSGEKQ
ncbi:hypothetical protein SEPCBS119000_004511 [Sporothrix epigloea]|uniref:BZIP domain-containing protein n=1 Tax=Sporothrix epigloea TaxID=1892477 RepID=A0ABP0DSN9_9PEZI